MAAQALNFVSVYKATIQHTSSTNCAATVRLILPLAPLLVVHPPSIPLTASVQTVGGVISLINDHLILRKKPPLGFLNPWLYGKGAEGLNDIIWGHNPGCGTGGFSAVPGWDPVRVLLR